MKNHLSSLNRATLYRCSVDQALTLHFAKDDISATIRLEGTLVLTAPNSRFEVAPEDRRTLLPVLQLIGRTLTAIECSQDGNLYLSLGEDVTIVAKADQDYEAWELQADNGLRIVSMPGGGLSLWDPKS
jgi:hypothetical protein